MKRARLLGAGAALATALAATDAAAIELGTPETAKPYHSAQNFSFELRFGPYLPEVDKEPGLHGTPFKNSFGENPRVYTGLEFDWQFYRIPGIGTFGPGLQIGRVSMGRDAVTVTGRRSGDSYSLTIYPIMLNAVLRVDVLWRLVGIPLMPYARVGAAVGFWNAGNSSGTATYNGVSGSGTSWGPNFAGGIAFPLNFFDPGSARGMDANTGINTTNLFAEYYWLDIDGPGQSHPLYIGDHTWVAGMMFEF